jgi:hypothetical protein
VHLIALSWDVERPGWLDPRVLGLARAVAGAGASCEVVSPGQGPAATDHVDGVEVTWAAEAPPVLPPTGAYDTARVLAAATRTSAAAEGRAQRRVPDAVLAVGWQTTWTATTLRTSRGTPIVALLDSTAPGRADGHLDDSGRLAAQVEWWLTYEARRVVVPTDAVGRALRRSYRLPGGKVDVVAPGVDLPDAPTATRDAVAVHGPPAVVARVRDAVGRHGVRTDRDATTRCSIVVALDDDPDTVLRAMAAGAAVVVPADGPTRGLVHARRSGLRVRRDPAAVTEAVATLRADPGRRARLGARARERVADRHAWSDVGADLLAVVRRAAAEEAELAGQERPARPLRPQLLRSPLGLVGDDAGG